MFLLGTLGELAPNLRALEPEPTTSNLMRNSVTEFGLPPVVTPSMA
jgi:hypothetical protein